MAARRGKAAFDFDSLSLLSHVSCLIASLDTTTLCIIVVDATARFPSAIARRWITAVGSRCLLPTWPSPVGRYLHRLTPIRFSAISIVPESGGGTPSTTKRHRHNDTASSSLTPQPARSQPAVKKASATVALCKSISTFSLRDTVHDQAISLISSFI